MSLVVALKRGFLIKHHGERYLEMSFEDFVEGFDISEDDCIWWSSLISSLTNGFGLPVDDKNGFQTMILKLRLQQLPQQVFLMLSHSPISANNHQVAIPLLNY